MIRIRNSKKGIEKLAKILDGQSVIAVTGTMAAGKNYICSLLEQKGWAAIDADILVHQAISNKAEIIKQHFESDALAQNIHIANPDGSINRRELGKLVFSNPELLGIQESIVYPEVTELAQQFINGHPKTIINATVLYKTPQLLNLCSSVVFVTAPVLKRFLRARKRDHLPAKQIINRFKNQKKLLGKYTENPELIKSIILVKN